MDLKSEIIGITHFPEVTVPHPDIYEPNILRDRNRPQRKNTCIYLLWRTPNGSYEQRRIYTYRSTSDETA